jgi:hypothetical protein
VKVRLDLGRPAATVVKGSGLVGVPAGGIGPGLLRVTLHIDGGLAALGRSRAAR